MVRCQDQRLMQPLMQWLLQKVLEQEMADSLGAAKGERREGRQGRSSMQLFERYQRSEKALVAALVEMYVQGVSTRKIKTMTEELCGHEFSASAISELDGRPDGELERFARRALEVEFPCLILDARHETVREDGVIRSRVVLVARSSPWRSPDARAPRAGASCC